MFQKIKGFFGIEERNSTIPKEIIGGIITFFSMIYICSVHPGIMAAAGQDFGRVFTGTAIAAGFVTILMGLLAKIPIALAPGLGLNAFVAFTVCGALGFSWQMALTAVLVEGILFIILSLAGIRQKIISAIPDVIKKGVALGIGLFIAVIGLANAGILTTGGGTVIGINSVTSGAPLVAIIGLSLMILLYTLKVPGSIFIAIIASTIIGIPLGVTALSENFSIIGLPSAPYFFQFAFDKIFTLDFIIIIISLLFIDLFDTVSTLAGVAIQGNLLDKNGEIINCKKALLTDAIGTTFGSLFGITTVTSYIESSTGVASGARTGLASVVTGILFLLALIFAPLFALIPSAATAPALIFVGFLMLGAISQIDLKDTEIGIPIFITMLMIPMSYSISQGLAFGFIAYTLVKISKKKFNEISIATWILTILFLIKIIFISV
ncbi:MAG: NCS2 family permease [Elusimicrobiota bacterium]|jgi:AGZA family xanthine/uracil permease-like MFS transporter|nr:NCS2 family permease [Elusimicrobiota bacterium]